MATRKSRSVNKRFSKVNEESPEKDGGNGNKSRQRLNIYLAACGRYKHLCATIRFSAVDLPKRKLSDMLGSQWSKEELERFYEAYRKYGKDWKKVAGVVRNRSTEMVEALYNMNRAYLSLPEGTASVVGLIAMMTDHYNILEGSDSERESNDAPGVSRKPQKRGRGKFQVNVPRGTDANVPDLLNFPSITSNYGCLSLLKKRRSGGSRPRAVGKRTPRFPVSYSHDKHDREKFVSPNKRGSKSDLDAHDDEVAHGAVLALAEALQRGGSPQVSRTPNRRSELIRPSPVRNSDWMQIDSEIVSAKHFGVTTDENCLECSLGSREAENGDLPRDLSYMMDTEGTGTVEVRKKGKKFHGKKPKVQYVENNHFDDVREACSGTEEGQNLTSVRVEDEGTDSKFGRSSPQGPRKRSRQLVFEAESSALDALYTLADVSLKLAPASTVESESSVQFKDEMRTYGIVDKSSIPETTSANRRKDKLKNAGAKEKALHSLTEVNVTALKNVKLGRDSGLDVNALSEAKKLPSQTTTKLRKQKRKSLTSEMQSPRNEALIETLLSEPLKKTEVVAEDGKKSVVKTKRVGLGSSLPKQGKSFKPPERSSSSTDPLRPGTDPVSSTVQVPTANQVNLPSKLRSRRKMHLQKALVRKEKNSLENIGNDVSNKHSSSQDGTLDLKEKLSRCLSSPLLRRWCAYEWFYSAIDYPWFAKKEFVEYLDHVGLGHVPRLTRVEWGVIRSSLGKPRRLSQQFLREEKEKLEQYRESVRTHYTELRTGDREGLPTDLARPLSVGQRVIACHPRTREFHDGSVLTVDRNRCRIQFDRPELGVEFVMDIDCMPLNPLENMPEALRRQNIAVDKLFENFNESKLPNQSKDWKTGGLMNVGPSEISEAADGTPQISSPTYPLNTSLKQAKGDTSNAISQAKAVPNEVCNTQKAAYTQPCTLAQIQAREADIRALSELTRALEKKEALVLELRRMNDEVYENQKDGDNSLKDFDPFKKQYAMVLIQLKEANDQVSSALMYLRQRNTYQGNSPPWLKAKSGSGPPVGPLNSVDQSSFLPQESASHVVEILESSRLKAQTMVDAAVQALSSLKEGEDAFASIGEALDSVNNRQNGPDYGMPTVRSFTSSDPGNGTLPYQDATNSYTAEPLVPVNSNGHTSEASDVRIPKELISSCVATLLMIQTCTERQYPPAEVAQILDSAVTSLQPCCSQNLPIYREIQMCMGLVKNQILALIPT